jgi:hypothetical protein
MADPKPPKDSGNEVSKAFTNFYGGMVRDDKSPVVGAGLDIEELDIWENANFVRPTTIFSADTLPSNTTIYAYCKDPVNGNAYAVGVFNNNGNGYICVLSKLGIAGGSPGAWTSVITGVSSVLNKVASAAVHYVNGSPVIYFVIGNNGLYSCLPSGSGGITSVGTLPGATASASQIMMRDIQGTLYIPAGSYISTVDNAGNFTQYAFTLPGSSSSYANQINGIDILYTNSLFFILCTNGTTPLDSDSVIIIWDGVSAQYVDSIPIPMGGPQWIYNFKSTLTICCCSQGVMKLFTLNTPSTGAIAKTYPNIYLTNVVLEGTSVITDAFNSNMIVAPSPAKSVFVANDVLYFAICKTDKSGLYAIAQLDPTKPYAFWLAKRFNSTNYANHTPVCAAVYGNIFTGSYVDSNSGAHTMTAMQCNPATANRSSLAFFQGTWDDNKQPGNLKDFLKAYLTYYPLSSGLSLALYIAADYASPSQIYSAAGGIASYVAALSTLVRTIFRGTALARKTVFQWKVAFTSSGTSCPILTGVVTRYVVHPLD